MLANPPAKRGEYGNYPPNGEGSYSAVDVLWLIWKLRYYIKAIVEAQKDFVTSQVISYISAIKYPLLNMGLP